MGIAYCLDGHLYDQPAVQMGRSDELKISNATRSTVYKWRFTIYCLYMHTNSPDVPYVVL